MFIPPIDWCPAINRHVRVDWSGCDCAAHHRCPKERQCCCPVFGNLEAADSTQPDPATRH